LPEGSEQAHAAVIGDADQLSTGIKTDQVGMTG
jgi:hypothetical protein